MDKEKDIISAGENELAQADSGEIANTDEKEPVLLPDDEKDNKDAKAKKSKKVWTIILVACVLVVAIGSVFIFRSCCQPDYNRETLTPTEPATQAPATEATPDTAPPETKAPATEPGPLTAFGYKLAELGDFKVDFDELEAINTDVYAWIYIPNTNVDYPVARSTRDGDDSFYLEHNIYRQYQFSGTIYSEVQNKPDMHDPVTVLYGHNMLNDSMFATLHYFEDPDFFKKNNTIFILTKDKVYTYLVYSAYTYDDRHILNSFFLKDDKVFQEYIDSTLNPHSYDANVRANVNLNTNNRILTLSTCTNGSGSTRYLVQGVLVDERKR